MKLIKIGGVNCLYTFVDDEDFEFVSKYHWTFNNNRYAHHVWFENGKFNHIKLHRLLLDVTDRNIIVDHVDGNGLNNMKSNIRVCNRFENGRNRKSSRDKSMSIFHGVSSKKRKWKSKKTGEEFVNQRWTAIISFNKKDMYLGSFENEIEASIAYDFKCIELFKEFSHPNFLNHKLFELQKLFLTNKQLLTINQYKINMENYKRNLHLINTKKNKL